MHRALIGLAILLGGWPAAAQLPDNQGLPGRYVELQRSDLRARKVEIISRTMHLDDKESAAFWPVYQKYAAAQAKLNDRRLENIKELLHKYDSMSEDEARRFAERSFGIERDRLALKERYFKKMCKVLPARRVARFFQVENQLNLLLDLQVTAELPIIE
jgi:hypothetical protein